MTRSGTEVFSGVYIDCTSSHPKWQQEILQKPSLAEHVSFGYLGVRFFFAIKLQQLREVAYLARGTFLPRAIICQIMATPGSVNCHSSAKTTSRACTCRHLPGARITLVRLVFSVFLTSIHGCYNCTVCFRTTSCATLYNSIFIHRLASSRSRIPRLREGNYILER